MEGNIYDKLAFFDQYLALFQKRHKIRPYKGDRKQRVAGARRSEH